MDVLFVSSDRQGGVRMERRQQDGGGMMKGGRVRTKLRENKERT